MEPWLRGPVFGVPTLLQPAAHALLLALEDVETAASSLSAEQLWQRPGGAASAGFHRLHLAGSTDRLLTYARDQTCRRRRAPRWLRRRHRKCLGSQRMRSWTPGVLRSTGLCNNSPRLPKNTLGVMPDSW
jgi:hypothetical protein